MVWFVILETWGHGWVIKQLFPAPIWLITLLHIKTTKQIWKHLTADAFIVSGSKRKLLLPLTQKYLVEGAAVPTPQLSHRWRWECYPPEQWAVQWPQCFPIPDTIKNKKLWVQIFCKCNEQCYDTTLFHINEERSCRGDSTGVMFHTLSWSN